MSKPTLVEIKSHLATAESTLKAALYYDLRNVVIVCEDKAGNCFTLSNSNDRARLNLLIDQAKTAILGGAPLEDSDGPP